MTDKIIGFPKNEIESAVQDLKRNLPAMIEHAKLLARIKRAAYLEYVNQGFTEQQALELAKSPV